MATLVPSGRAASKVLQPSIHPDRQGRIQQAGADALRQISAGGAVRQFTDRVIGESDTDGHDVPRGEMSQFSASSALRHP